MEWTRGRSLWDAAYKSRSLHAGFTPDTEAQRQGKPGTSHPPPLNLCAVHTGADLPIVSESSIFYIAPWNTLKNDF